MEHLNTENQYRLLTTKDCTFMNLKNTLNICGNPIDINDIDIDETGEPVFKAKQAVIRAVYQAYMETGYSLPMYLHSASVESSVYLDNRTSQSMVLNICNSFLNIITKYYNTIKDVESQENVFIAQYAMYYAQFIKAFLVDHIPDLDCDICRFFGAKEETFESIQADINEVLKTSNNPRLYRIIAYVMSEFDEVDKSVQLLDLLYSWYKLPDDLIDSIFLQSISEGFSKVGDLKTRGIETCEAHLIRAYYFSEVDSDTENILHELDCALDCLSAGSTYTFRDLANTLAVLYVTIEALENTHYDDELYQTYIDLKAKTIDEMQNPDKSIFLNMALYCGIGSEDFVRMLDTFLSHYDEEGDE